MLFTSEKKFTCICSLKKMEIQTNLGWNYYICYFSHVPNWFSFTISSYIVWKSFWVSIYWLPLLILHNVLTMDLLFETQEHRKNVTNP